MTKKNAAEIRRAGRAAGLISASIHVCSCRRHSTGSARLRKTMFLVSAYLRGILLLSRGTEAPALLRCRGRDGKRLARGAEVACISAGLESADSRSRRRNWIWLARTHRQIGATYGSWSRISERCAGTVGKRRRSREESARSCKHRAYRASRRLLTDSVRRDPAENLTGVSAGDAKRARQIARLEQQRHSRRLT